STLARFSASTIAIRPSSCACSVPSAPLNEPMGVRAAAAITTSVMGVLLLFRSSSYSPLARPGKAQPRVRSTAVLWLVHREARGQGGDAARERGRAGRGARRGGGRLSLDAPRDPDGRAALRREAGGEGARGADRRQPHAGARGTDAAREPGPGRARALPARL